MSFGADVRRFALESERQLQTLLDRVSEDAFESIVHGSILTGSPGQPRAPEGVEGAGKLQESWTKMRGPNNVEVSTDVGYALDVEDNPRGVRFHRGGSHSVKLTIAAFPRIVAHEVAVMRGGQ